MKHLKKFNSIEEYEVYINSLGASYPNVSYILEDKKVMYAAAPKPLYVEAIDDLTVKFSKGTIQYSLDGVTWNDLPAATATPTISNGSKVYFKATGLTPSSSVGIGTFSMTGKCNVGGNIMSMIYGDDFDGQAKISASYQFQKLFYSGINVVDASKLLLPATSLASYCYDNMFYGCTSLVNAPVLPATTLSGYCYQYMFYGCTSLVNAPALPATRLSGYCYRHMFNGCKSLVNAPALPATTLSSYCYEYMFSGCTSLVNAPALPATSLASSCYYCMFRGCTSLVNAPALPATTLVSSCYGNMFSGCTSLVNAPVLPATSLEYYCYSYMFQNCSNLNHVKAMFLTRPSSTYTSSWLSGVSATGTFVKNAAATWSVTGVDGIPEGWTVETAAA